MTLLAVAEIQAAFETDLAPGVLQIFLDDAEAAITRRAGDAATQVDRGPGRTRHYVLSRRAASITTVKEILGDTTTTLAATDYALVMDGRAIERQPTGAAWPSYGGEVVFGPIVEVTYAPFDDSATRKRVQLDLVKLALTYRGAIKTESSGDYTADASRLETYEQERLSLLASLAPSIGVVV